MDSTSITIIVIMGSFAIIAIVAFLIYRSRTKVSIKGPFDTSLELEGEQDSTQPNREQVMRKSEYGDQEMSGQGSDQRQDMDESPHGKQKMN